METPPAPAPGDAECAAIVSWLEREGYRPGELVPLTGDVSLRRYFRVRLDDRRTAIVAWYPEELRPVCHRFLATSALLRGGGVPVPAVLATRCGHGMTLLEDAGDRTLHQMADLGWSVLRPIFRRAASFIPRIQALSRDVVGTLCPPLDAALLRWELEKTWKLFLEPAGLAGDGTSREALRRALDDLCGILGDGPVVPCHRDFMARNLMPRGGAVGELLVLDHQDLRLGPAAYDLASLLNDTLFPPRDLEDELLARWLPEPELRMSYRRTVIQRTLKAIGNYCDFAGRGFRRHLPLVRPTLARAQRHLPHLPETREVAAIVEPFWSAYLAGDDTGPHL
jgi:N-acetylmuramate 1-kinase